MRGCLTAVVAVVMSSACGGAQSEAPPAPVAPRSTLQPMRLEALAVAPQLNNGVSVVAADCQQSAAERCNGLDENCDGVIDDGCGYQAGSIQITASWDSGADVDLYVTDPAGETIMYNAEHRRSASGGVMDHDARGDCRREQQNAHVENVYWAVERPPSGKYQVDVGYWGPCGDAGDTHTTVSIAVGRKVLGVFGYTLSREERVHVASFTLR
jgi:tRNA (guanosine-2'-O-)-methyltransferase